MYTTKERIAIARIVSDMIKADNIIEESEIEMLNKLKKDYNLDSRTLSEARHIRFSTAIADLECMKDEEKIAFFKHIQSMAIADGVCVPREAMLLLALRYSLGIECNPKDKKQYQINHNKEVKLISCPTGETSITSQYVIYIEGKYNEEINDNLKKTLEMNVLHLRQWGFDFIYIPSLIDEFRSMNANYVKEVIGYMAPELADETIDIVYKRLLKMDTVNFCNHVLAEKLHVDAVKNAKPSLFINIGTSVVPYCSVSGPVECYTEFMCIPLLDKDIVDQIKEFVQAYSKLVSFFATPNPTNVSDSPNRFKYFGFYKAMFDFLVKAEPKESDIIIHPWNNLFEFPHVPIDDLKLTPQEAALYKLILECTYNHPLGGLPSAYDVNYQKEIEKMYRKIYHNNSATFPNPLAPIRSKIESKMRKHLAGLANLEDYIPKMKDGMYVIAARPERIKIRSSHYDSVKSFVDYHWE